MKLKLIVGFFIFFVSVLAYSHPEHHDIEIFSYDILVFDFEDDYLYETESHLDEIELPVSNVFNELNQVHELESNLLLSDENTSI